MLKKLFSIKYRTLREYFAYLLCIPVLGHFVCVMMLLEEPFIDVFRLAFTIISTLWFLYCCSYKPMQWLFKKKGKAYDGKIVKAEMMYGTGENTYYLFIEFYRERKKLIRRTSGYMGSPNIYLENDRCHIYEFMGKFIEADFNVRKKFPENKEECLNIKIEKHKMFMPKGNKYV